MAIQIGINEFWEIFFRDSMRKSISVFCRDSRSNYNVGSHYVKFMIFYDTNKIPLNKCMTKMENFVGSRKVTHILKVWSLLSTKKPISSRSVENSLVMSHFPAAHPEFTNSTQLFFPKL